MAATYSAFMTTRFYSPVFNTALFDGPFRIYFSQSYESSALKIYHILQTQHPELWQNLKQWSQKTKEHVFLLMYPEAKDVEMIFGDQAETAGAFDKAQAIQLEEWDEGIAVGLCQPLTDKQVGDQIDSIKERLHVWLEKQRSNDFVI